MGKFGFFIRGKLFNLFVGVWGQRPHIYLYPRIKLWPWGKKRK
jgi:hypothetical protein